MTTSDLPIGERELTAAAAGEESEAAFLAALAEGDSSAFWPLWQRHSDRLFAVCLRELAGNRADAEDALSQTMMKALAKLPLVAGEVRCLAAWLIRVTRNLCRDIHRQRARSMRVEADLMMSRDSGGEPDRYSEEGPDPALLIASLPLRLQEVFVLRTIHNMTYDDIAARVHVTCATARKRVQEARSTLQDRRNGDAVIPAMPNGAPQSASESPAVTECPLLRAKQKISTLRAYVKRHPAGWKKHLMLGDLLYATGAWMEAAACYKHVLRKRSWLTAVSVKLESIDEALGLEIDPEPLP